MQDYSKAEVEYRKALSKNSHNTQAMYNLGCALMQQKRDSLAITWLEKSAREETVPLRRSKAYHNIGWVCQSHGLYAEAIEAYKSSLRLNPSDDETRYNLALCKRQQKKNQGGNNDKEKKQDNKDDKQNKDNKEKQQKDDQQKNNKQQKNQQPKEQMSKENAEQLLNAAMQEEKATQQRLKKSMQQPQRQKLDKNW